MSYSKAKKIAVTDRKEEMQMARVQKYLSIAENVLFNMASATPYQGIEPKEMVKKAFEVADAYVATIYSAPAEEEKKEPINEENYI